MSCCRRAARCLPALGVLLVAVGACSATPSPPPEVSRPLDVAVSLPPLAWLVERLGGDSVEVRVILPAGASPELWTPSPGAMLAASGADLYVAIGHPDLPFERRLIEQARVSGAEIVTFVDALGGSSGRISDPHPWLVPAHLVALSEVLVERLESLQALAVPTLEVRHRALLETVENTRQRMGELLAERQRHSVIVQHPAWGPLLATYGIEEVAIERDGKQPDPPALIRLIESARVDGVGVIFTQRGISSRSARLVAGEIGARLEALDPLERDWQASMLRSAAAFAEALN